MPRGSMIKADVAGQFFAICPMKMEAYMNILNGPEISKAEELGAEVVKIFPAPAVGGAEFIKAVKGPMPWTNIMPTGDGMKKAFRPGKRSRNLG